MSPPASSTRKGRPRLKRRSAYTRENRLHQTAREQGFLLRKSRKRFGCRGRFLILDIDTLEPATGRDLWLTLAEVEAFLSSGGNGHG